MIAKVPLPTAVALGLFLLAVSADARHFTVTLANGTILETRYEPVPADWDPGLTMLLTDRGNWMALENREIVEVEAHEDRRAFGEGPDTTPRFLGWVWVEENPEDEEQAAGEPRYELPEPNRPSSIDRFLTFPGLDPADAGGGIPLGLFSDPVTNTYLETFTDRFFDFDDDLGEFTDALPAGDDE